MFDWWVVCLLACNVKNDDQATRCAVVEQPN